jgi:hypothetical protein
MSENWRISKNRSNLECSPWYGAICIEISDDSVHVPSIVAWTTRGSEDKANLIAAAPKLLEALESLLNKHVELVESGDCGHWNVEKEGHVIAARAILAEAKGEKDA